jgi:hypothetical protein
LRAFRKSAAIAAALACFALAFPTQAPAALSWSCQLALNSACGAERPDSRALTACLSEHSSRLSRSCGAKFPHIVAVASRCEADPRRYCSHVARVASIPGCMQNRLEHVGQPCRSALAQIGVGGARKR